MSNKNQYNKTVAAMWKTKTGNFLTMKLDERTLEQIRALAAGAEPGGKLIIKNLAEETREKFKGGTERAPHAFLEYMSAESVAKFEAEKQQQRTAGDSGL